MTNHLDRATDLMEEARELIDQMEEQVLSAIEAGEIHPEELYGRFDIGRASFQLDPYFYEGYTDYDGLERDGYDIVVTGPIDRHAFGWYSSGDGPGC